MSGRSRISLSFAEAREMETGDREETLRRQSLIMKHFKSREILRVVNSDAIAIVCFVSRYIELNLFVLSHFH